MSIVRARLQSYSLPLRDPWPSPDGDVTERRGWIVALEDDQGRMGLGEAAPFPGFGLETYASAGAALRLALKHLLGLPAEQYSKANQDLCKLAPIAAARTARAAIDLALRDLMAQEYGLPLAQTFGEQVRFFEALGEAAARDGQVHKADMYRREAETAAVRVEVSVNATIPRMAPERMAERAARAVADGYGTLKLKVGGVPIEEDVARVRLLRETVGPSVRIRVDANQAWSPDEAIVALRTLGTFDLEYAEQPVAAEDVEGLARVRRECGVKIAADESLNTLQSLAKMLELIQSEAMDVLIMKPSALGGFRLPTLVRRAADGILPIVVTSLLESVVGRTAAVHFAASLGLAKYAHGVATGDAFTRDLVEGPFQSGGKVHVPDAPGLGVRLPESFWKDAHIVEGE